MIHPNNIVAMWSLGFATCKMMAEAQAVIGFRVLGMAGIWSVTPNENARMITEKTKALRQSAAAASKATLQGNHPEKVFSRALTPIGNKTSANYKRLSKRGFSKR
ncbi:antifreeze protein [Yoonia maritima]|uniref:antifreeze protein n=1 Tax=Yoonia maritima TaxID=1435347 RepID=UPI001EF874E4|nr:antifreeze protein [Yoonia maritima]